jgi:hypothetical protein
MTPEEAKQIPAIVPLEFWTDYEPKRDAKGNEVPGEFAAHDKVKWAKKGQNSGAETVEKIARLRKDPALWGVIERHYEAWKKGQEVPVDGTPIDACPFVTKELAKVLKTFRVLSAEDLANATDGDMAKMNVPGIAGVRAKARTFLEAKKGEAIVAAAMARRDEENAALRAQVEELTRTVAQLAAGKPRRERPADVAAA